MVKDVGEMMNSSLDVDLRLALYAGLIYLERLDMSSFARMTWKWGELWALSYMIQPCPCDYKDDRYARH
jgi:hypothetical protein